ncbi:hypothetical protein ACWDUL_26960 [Nocardia niigatensis]
MERIRISKRAYWTAARSGAARVGVGRWADDGESRNRLSLDQVEALNQWLAGQRRAWLCTQR